MKKILFISLAFFISCNVLHSENDETEIRYVVKDFSDTPVDKEITYVHGNGAELVVIDNTDHWERTSSFIPHLDASLSAKVVSDELISMGVYIYKNGELVKSEEYDDVHSLSISHLN